MPESDPLNSWMVIAHLEDECAIWPTTRARPSSWRATGISGTRAVCEAYIDTLDTERRASILRQCLERETIMP